MDQHVYLIVQFNFPRPFHKEFGDKARDLHQAVDSAEWIQEVLAASGGIGGGPSSIWVFKVRGYADLARLSDRADPVGMCYRGFFGAMDDVEDILREEIGFAP